jgi:hypothetical protein
MPHGFLIAADLEDASGLDQIALVKGVEGIRGWYRDLWEARQRALFSPFIDGALIALPMDELKDHKDVYCELIESCEKWIRSVAEIDPDLSLRVAIHQGNFFPVLENLPTQVIVGPDALHCSRLVRLASGGQVIISEEYRDHWRRFNLRSYDQFVADKRLHPSGDRPLLFWQKPSKPSQIRYVVPSRTEHVPSSAEKRAALAIRTALRLMVELQFDLAVYLQVWLDKAMNNMFTLENGLGDPEAHLFGRVSIFRVDPENPNQLICWLRLDRDRYGDGEETTADLMSLEFPRATVYEIDPPSGPLGIAYAEKTWKFINGLPDWADGQESRRTYRKIMQTWSFPVAKTDKMHNHSRSFFILPFSEADLVSQNGDHVEASVGPENRPVGVLCIDFDDPLEFLGGQEVLEEFCRDYSLYLFSLFAACSMRDGS